LKPSGGCLLNSLIPKIANHLCPCDWDHSTEPETDRYSSSVHGIAPADSNKGNSKMIANLSTETNEIRTLSAIEVEAVSGGAVVKLFDFKVAGMHVVGVANTDTGDSVAWVKSGDSLYINGKKV